MRLTARIKKLEAAVFVKLACDLCGWPLTGVLPLITLTVRPYDPSAPTDPASDLCRGCGRPFVMRFKVARVPVPFAEAIKALSVPEREMALATMAEMEEYARSIGAA